MPAEKNASIPKGVHDPWRIGTPEWDPPKKKQKQRQTTGNRRQGKHNRPLDWDIQPDKKCMVFLNGAEGALVVSGTDETKNAADIIMQAVQTIPDISLGLEHAGFIHGPITDVKLKNFFLKSKDYVITHPEGTKQTFTRLVRVFLRTNRTKYGHKALDKLGIRPLLGGS